jgi:hypothetical protein
MLFRNIIVSKYLVLLFICKRWEQHTYMLIKEGMLISKYGKTPVNWLLDKFLQEYVIDENVISRVLVLFKFTSSELFLHVSRI